VKHVIFDIGGVLIDFDFPRLARALGERTGGDADGLLPLFAQAVVRDVEAGHTDPEEFFRRTMSPALPGLTYEGWISAWMDNYSVNEPGWALLEDARDQGRTVSLLSNLAPYNQLAIERKWPHFFQAPHHNFYSYELGFHKPDPDIYRAVSKRLGAEPEHCFFLDDVEENVESARRVGFQGLRFEKTKTIAPGVDITFHVAGHILGSALTTLHLVHEKEASALLGIPDDVLQVALLPVGYTRGTDFKRAERPPIENITHWNQW